MIKQETFEMQYKRRAQCSYTKKGWLEILSRIWTRKNKITTKLQPMTRATCRSFETSIAGHVEQSH